MNEGRTQLDHVVVAAATLAQGVAWCEATLGVSPGPGGSHVLMSTHNRLLHIAGPGFPGVYLEIIAIDPDAPPPGRARWFALDDAALQARLQHSPRLIHVVARTTTLALQQQQLRDAGHDLGEIIAASRAAPQGLLSWQIAVPADGRLAHCGVLPTLIQWQGQHPTEHMPTPVVTLTSLLLQGLPETAQAGLALTGVGILRPGTSPIGSPSTPALQATFSTPRGEVVLRSDD